MPVRARNDRKKPALLKRLGSNLRLARERLGLTQERLAERVDLAPRTVQKIEAGQLNILVTTLARLSEALECSSADLLEK